MEGREQRALMECSEARVRGRGWDCGQTGGVVPHRVLDLDEKCPGTEGRLHSGFGIPPIRCPRGHIEYGLVRAQLPHLQKGRLMPTLQG